LSRRGAKVGGEPVEVYAMGLELEPHWVDLTAAEDWAGD
jgi:hypothetical protein